MGDLREVVVVGFVVSELRFVTDAVSKERILGVPYCTLPRCHDQSVFVLVGGGGT